MVLTVKSKPPTTLQHKKRTGAHHRQGKHYTKPYLPYLPLASIVGIGLIANVLWAHSNSGVLGATTDITTANLLQSSNVQRTQNREADLQFSDQLTAAAQAKASDMAARNYWSHDTPNGRTPWQFISAEQYNYAAAGENLAYGFTSSNAVLNGWMHSAKHRANVLGQHYTQVGFGIASAKNFQGHGPETIVVAMYAEPAVTTASTHSNIGTPASTGMASTLATTTQPASQRIARVQALNGNFAWSLLVVAVFGTGAALWFATRHVLAWKRVLVHGEEFVIHHRTLDILIVTATVASFVLTRTAGFIR